MKAFFIMLLALNLNANVYFIKDMACEVCVDFISFCAMCFSYTRLLLPSSPSADNFSDAGVLYKNISSFLASAIRSLPSRTPKVDVVMHPGLFEHHCPI
ncbi:hypothetical protein, partial [Campylobacter sp. 2018MI27]|uniref:hypothetical protein n=1 Tax=Campylobacter sp. 2018MI27 TaxID=2836738 RepID=UPI001BD9337B